MIRSGKATQILPDRNETPVLGQSVKLNVHNGALALFIEPLFRNRLRRSSAQCRFVRCPEQCVSNSLYAGSS